jgi:hypothetical protein
MLSEIKTEMETDFQLPTGVEIKGGRVDAYRSLQYTREMALKWRYSHTDLTPIV